MLISILNQVLTSIVIPHYHSVSWCKLQIHTVVGGSSIFHVGIQAIKHEKIYTQG